MDGLRSGSLRLPPQPSIPVLRVWLSPPIVAIVLKYYMLEGNVRVILGGESPSQVLIDGQF